MVGVPDAKRLGYSLKLLSSRINPRQMTLHMGQQAGHLTEYVAIRCKGEKVSLGSVEVAPCPLNQRSIAEEAEPSLRVQRSDLGRLPGRLKVTVNRLR
jgi:hypothetical protein